MEYETIHNLILSIIFCSSHIFPFCARMMIILPIMLWLVFCPITLQIFKGQISKFSFYNFLCCLTIVACSIVVFPFLHLFFKFQFWKFLSLVFLQLLMYPSKVLFILLTMILISSISFLFFLRISIFLLSLPISCMLFTFSIRELNMLITIIYIPGLGISKSVPKFSGSFVLWQSPFHHRVGMCCGEDFRHGLQVVFFLLCLLGSQGDFSWIPTWWNSKTMGVSISHVSPHIVFSNLSKLPLNCSYHLRHPVASVQGK